MARVPGTEAPRNRCGLQPGDAVRCRRSQVNADRGLANQRGFLAEVRHGRVRVLLDMAGRTLWLESEDVLTEPLTDGSRLEALRQVYVQLGAHRLDFDEEDGLTFFSEGFPAQQLDVIRKLVSNRLLSLDVLAAGVHEVAVRMQLQESPSDPGASTPDS